VKDYSWPQYRQDATIPYEVEEIRDGRHGSVARLAPTREATGAPRLAVDADRVGGDDRRARETSARAGPTGRVRLSLDRRLRDAHAL